MTHALDPLERDQIQAAANEPYGPASEAHYADPGYQGDNKKRYPLSSPKKCRSAWAYINMPKNAAKYSAQDLAKIKARIKAAGKKYGIEFADEVKAAAELRDVELARPGTWKLASGPLTVTPEMLADAARFANRENARPGFLKIGHTDTRFMAGDGEPALGWVHNVRLEEDDQGEVLKGDLTGMPDWLGKAIPLHWPDRSIEGWADYEHEGQKYGLVMSGLALLGVTPPGMSSIRSLRDLPAALGLPVSASGRPIFASFGESQTPTALEAVGAPPTKKGAGMDPDIIREGLGLDSDASDDEVREAFLAAYPSPEAPPTPVAASAGTVVLASSVWDETQKTIKNLTAYVEKAKRDERDEVIGKAVQAGKFTPAQMGHFATMWDNAPDATRALIDALTPNSALAVVASGYAGEGVEADAEYAALFGSPDARKAG